jgi:hypothetical protein
MPEPSLVPLRQDSGIAAPAFCQTCWHNPESVTPGAITRRSLQMELQQMLDILSRLPADAQSG